MNGRMDQSEDDHSSYCSSSSSSYSSDQKRRTKKKQRPLVISSSTVEKAVTTTTTTNKKKKKATTNSSCVTKNNKRTTTPPKKQKVATAATPPTTNNNNHDEYYNRFITNDIQNRIETTIQRILKGTNSNNITNIWNEFMIQLDLQYVNRSDVEQCVNIVTTTTSPRDDDDDNSNDDANIKKEIEQNLINLAIKLYIQDEKCKLIFQMIDSTDHKQFITVYDLRIIVDDIFGSNTTTGSKTSTKKKQPQNGNLENVSNDELQEMIDYFTNDDANNDDNGILTYTHIIKIARTINL